MISKFWIFGLLTFLCGVSAHAALDVCGLQTKPINTSAFTAQEIASYQARIKNECELYTTYQNIKAKAKSKYNIELTQISLYQAMRYVERQRYEEAKTKDIPVQKIYQIHKADYNLSNDEKSSAIWDNFQVGVLQLDGAREKLLRGEDFTFSELSQIHKGYFTLSDEIGDFSHDPVPGVIRPPHPHDLPWWKLADQKEIDFSVERTKLLNAEFDSYGLDSYLPDSGSPTLNQVISVHQYIDGDFAVFTGDSRANPDHYKKLLDFMNRMLKLSMRGEHMSQNGKLISPAQLAYLVQHFYVDAHGFHEGNGRTSRFMQELILTSFDLPHGSSGDLMEFDAFTPNEEYYALAMKRNFEELNEVSGCFVGTYRTNTLFSSKNLSQIDPKKIDYQCRLVN